MRHFSRACQEEFSRRFLADDKEGVGETRKGFHGEVIGEFSGPKERIVRLIAPAERRIADEVYSFIYFPPRVFDEFLEFT